MRFPVWVACCERTVQLLVRRRARHVWLLTAVFVLLIFFFKNISLTDPTEPFLRRSYSPSEGISGVSVVYTAPDSSNENGKHSSNDNEKHSSNGNDIDSTNENHADNKGKQDNVPRNADTSEGNNTTSSHNNDEYVSSSMDSVEDDGNDADDGPESESELSDAVVADSSSSLDVDVLRVRELPFQTEPDFKVFDWVKFYGRKRNSSQPITGMDATIPPEILKIISDALESDGNETDTGESLPKTPLPENKNPQAQPKSFSFIDKIVESLKAQARNKKDNNFLLRVLDFFGMNPPDSPEETNIIKPSSFVAGSGSAEQSEENLPKEEASYASKDNKHSKTASGGQSSGSDSDSVSLRSIVGSLQLVSNEGANGTTTLTKLNSTWKAVQKERKRLLKSRCDKASTHHKLKEINAAVSANGINVNSPQAIVDRDRFLSFCPVQNAASTMLKRLMFSLDALNHSAKAAFFSNTSSPEELPFVYLPTILSKKGAEHFVGNSVRFLITRDPFVRIFAAYVDHLFVPNFFYWKHWGVTVVSRYRHSPSQRSTQCGHDVMFPEFVKYVIETLHTSDPLLEPMHVLCAACQFKFSVLGHVETLHDDFEYLTTLLGVSVSNYSADTLMDDVSKDVILNSTHGVFQFFKELKPCVSKHEIGKRLWRKLQMMGIISDDLGFPLSLDESVKQNAEDLVQLFLKAREKSQNVDRLLAQKYQTLKEAYSKVPTEHILKLVEIYSLDFELFGYSKDPRFLDMDI